MTGEKGTQKKETAGKESAKRKDKNDMKTEVVISLS